MLSLDGIPVVSQVKSLVQYAQGDTKGAKRTQRRFTKQCIGVSQVRSAIEAVSGDMEAARKTQEEFTRTAPIVSQIRSAVEEWTGDAEAAEETRRMYVENIVMGSLKETKRRKRTKGRTKGGGSTTRGRSSTASDRSSALSSAADEDVLPGGTTLMGSSSAILTHSTASATAGGLSDSESAIDSGFYSSLIEVFCHALPDASALEVASISKLVAEFTGKLESEDRVVSPSVPFEFICPVGYCMMNDPVICSDGQTYDREHIEAWLAENDTSPYTGLQLEDTKLIPNLALRNLIEDWKKKYGDDW